MYTLDCQKKVYIWLCKQPRSLIIYRYLILSKTCKLIVWKNFGVLEFRLSLINKILAQFYYLMQIYVPFVAKKSIYCAQESYPCSLSPFFFHFIFNCIFLNSCSDTILGTFTDHGGGLFWHLTTKLPLQAHPIVCWKFCHVLHKLLREGHPNVGSFFACIRTCNL